MAMRKSDREFFAPIWRRIAITVAVGIWSAVEWWNGNQLWGAMTGLLVAYCVWTFFIAFKTDDEAE